ncbi:hypothetical protein TYRP_001368 [Tyrophagus putrescentiae]|nr:hypothetical protein TYRP_001368 [Tyrophagus putrescentiae]
MSDIRSASASSAPAPAVEAAPAEEAADGDDEDDLFTLLLCFRSGMAIVQLRFFVTLRAQSMPKMTPHISPCFSVKLLICIND